MRKPDGAGGLIDSISSRAATAIVLGFLLVVAEFAYFSGSLSSVRSQDLIWYLFASPVLIPIGILTSASALVALSISLIVERMEWKLALFLAAVVLQFWLWPDSPRCRSRSGCEDPLEFYRHVVIFFWIIAIAFHGAFFFLRAKNAVESDPYLESLRERNVEVRSRREHD